MSGFDEPDDTWYQTWAQPDIPLAALPRIRIDRQGLCVAAETIVRFEEPSVVRYALASGDPRLKSFLNEAIARRKGRAA